MFCLPAGYRENRPSFFLDDVTEERGLVFQPDVYALAETLAVLGGKSKIVDVGCGWAGKLAILHDHHPEWEFVGIDYDQNIAHCREVYEWGTWVELDLERPMVGFLEPEAVVICSDVIEHLVDPTDLVHSLRDCGAHAMVISTPERDVQHGPNHAGPSPNLCHVREWNAPELHAYLVSEGLTVRFLGLTRGHDQSWIMPTQVAICT